MNIQQDFESNILAGQSPNILILEDVDTIVTATFTVFGNDYVFSYDAINDEVWINILELSKLVYGSKKDFSDPFDYSGTVTYAHTDGYHTTTVSMTFEDSAGDIITKQDVPIINAALQVHECKTMDDFIDLPLCVEGCKTPIIRPFRTRIYEDRYELLYE